MSYFIGYFIKVLRIDFYTRWRTKLLSDRFCKILRAARFLENKYTQVFPTTVL